MIKTYKGILYDGEQTHIRLKTNKGDIGYRIVKFEIMQKVPGTITQESVVKVYKIEQPEIGSDSPPVYGDGVVDFSDGDLLATAIFIGSDNANYQYQTPTVIFDREMFNQDIYVTHKDISVGEDCNWYLELERIKLNENESTMATLQSLRRLGLPRN